MSCRINLGRASGLGVCVSFIHAFSIFKRNSHARFPSSSTTKERPA